MRSLIADPQRDVAKVVSAVDTITWPPALVRWIELPIRFIAIWRSAGPSATTGGDICAARCG